ncbi:pantothenate kinase [Umbelopsis sp. AD052]|nr:pantothenate kinase [Umbelopsis sp. AD052]
MPVEPAIHPTATPDSTQSEPSTGLLSPQFVDPISSPLTLKPEMNVEGATVSELASHANDTRDIVLPNQTEHVSQIAIDIGGSLAKIVYFTSSNDIKGGRLHFKKFETEKIDECLDFIAELVEDAKHINNRNEQVVKATGGGAYLFQDKIAKRLPGITIQKEDEMECLINGLNFFITEIPYEVFTYSETNPMQFEERTQDLYPYMLVNIGSGVSILKVTGPDEFSRISGTSLGGGTLWGLLSLLTGAQSFDEMLDLSQNGDNRNVDLLVGDIYGSDYSKLGLKSTRIASSFGKVFKKGVRQSQDAFHAEDISKSLLFMVSNNIGQIAYLVAQQHGLRRIYFGGCYIRGHPVTMNTLSYAINFWSKGEMKALFLRHEGHLGATGAFLKHKPIRRARHSFSYSENFTPQIITGNPSNVYGVLEQTKLELRSKE